MDQILSTLSNLVISIAVSRLAGARELGSFTLIFTTAVLLQGFQRSLIAEPLLTLPLGRSRTGEADPEGAAITSAVIFAVGVAAAALVVGLTTQRTIILVLAAVIPGLLLQDLLRYAAFRRQRPWQAAWLDLVWVAGVTAGLPLMAEHRTANVAILLWGLGAWLAVDIQLLRRQLTFARLGTARRWWVRDARRMGGLLALDSVVYTAANQGATYGLAAIVGLQGLGELRSAQIVIGPTGIALTALQLYALPRLAGKAPSSWRDVCRLSGAAVGLALVLVTAAVLAGHLIGVRILGEPLRAGLDLLLPLAVVTVLGAATVGPLLALKSLRDVGAYSVTHLASVAIGVPGMLVIADRFGLLASVWAGVGQAALDTSGVVLALHLVRRRLARAGVDPGEVAAEPTQGDPRLDGTLVSGA